MLDARRRRRVLRHGEPDPALRQGGGHGAAAGDRADAGHHVRPATVVELCYPACAVFSVGDCPRYVVTAMPLPMAMRERHGVMAQRKHGSCVMGDHGAWTLEEMRETGLLPVLLGYNTFFTR